MLRDQRGWPGMAGAGLKIRRSWFRAPPAPPGRLHISSASMFTSGSDILVCWPLGGRGHGWRGWGWRPGASCGGAGGAVAVVVIGWRAVARGVLRWLWRGCELGEGGAASVAGPGREPGGCAALVVGLPGVVGGEDALVAGGEGAGEPQHEGREAHEAAPAAGDVVAGGVLDRGVGSLGAGAPGVGAPPLRGGGGGFLPGLGCDLGSDG